MLNLTKVLLGIVLGFLCLVLPAMPSASAASLWSSDPGANINMYSDRKAHTVGDIITVIINESSSANRVGKADNTKSSQTNVGAGAGMFKMLENSSAGNSDNFQAKGSISNSNNVNGKLTAQVVEVQPNGNLIIYGTQSIKQNGEEQKIIVSGIVRAEDITINNTILSSLLANAQIRIEGSGAISNKQRQGTLSQLFNFLF